MRHYKAVDPIELEPLVYRARLRLEQVEIYAQLLKQRGEDTSDACVWIALLQDAIDTAENLKATFTLAE